MSVTPIIRRPAVAAIALLALGACSQSGFDFDLRDNLGNAFDTTDAVMRMTEDRPKPDNRGVISYPGYQVAIARGGDSVADVAARVSLDARELATYNGLPMNVTFRAGEVLALPRRVVEPSPATGAPTSGPIRPAPVQPATATSANASGGTIKVASLDGGSSGSAISSNATTGTVIAAAPAPATSSGTEPIRHKVERGETAYSISRLYDVPVSSLAQWNGLDSALTVRIGQYLLIPVVSGGQIMRAEPAVNQPGTESVAPVPPSAAQPLPQVNETPEPPKEIPPSPNLAKEATPAPAASDARMDFPVTGPIIRAYLKKKNDGIDISAPAGTPVKAAAEGEVAAITRDTDQVPILVLRHPNNLLTVYAGIDQISVAKGDRIKRGQVVAKVRAADPSFVHFEVREGFESVDPVPYLE